MSDKNPPGTLSPACFSLMALFWCSAALGCLSDPGQPVLPPSPERSAQQPVVYGEDDRADWYAHPDEALQDLARLSAVALIPLHEVDESDPESIQIEAVSLGEQQDLCDGERFADQPAAAACSATLIDDDLVLTAGHCVVVQAMCHAFRLVFNYRMVDEEQLAPITAEDVFRCKELLVEADTLVRGELDYAIIRLDRPATPRFTPAPVRLEAEELEVRDPVVLIGFPNGLPVKIDDGGRVTHSGDEDLTTFTTTSDAFSGNSGSGVFDASGQVIGVLVTGIEDYRLEGDCYVVWEVSDSRGYEGVTYVHQAIAALCETGYPSERLCGTVNVCGDGFCVGEETRDNCPRDCLPGFVVPDGWTCDPDLYHALDRCDCECGVYDPDCDRPDLEVANCPAGSTCNQAGECVLPEADPEEEADAGEGVDAGQGDQPDMDADLDRDPQGDAAVDPAPPARQTSDSGCSITGAGVGPRSLILWMGLVFSLLVAVTARIRPGRGPNPNSGNLIE
ncbi:MAG: trypsin-like peptidase domain-containing protein [Bradymonadales bacterium]|nr:trypsin-like peptidase domain-containing protein [Bradymonadales bacterium]